MEVLFFPTPADLKKWFVENHDQLGEVWVGYYKKSVKKDSITWEESVEEAICYGWIDGIRKTIDEESYKIRFTPRKKNSIWSLKNINTVEKLIKEKRMQESGLAAYKLRKESKSGIYAFEQEKTAFSKEFESQFRQNNKAWKYFNEEAPYYKKIAIHWVMSAKQEKTRIKRLETLIEDSENHLRIKSQRR
ncbi:MAG: bacteriocin-protection protein [Thalassobius sp.]|nr:bacteriocin-protection protein [Thalassovita sp.]|tara:strand:- start:101 stop:670 length:570 start_codon:yes stop_codon:yes gene_type:complete